MNGRRRPGQGAGGRASAGTPGRIAPHRGAVRQSFVPHVNNTNARLNAWQGYAQTQDFSMREEVLSTELHYDNPNSNFRHSKIDFVSAGELSGAELTNAPQEGEELGIDVQPRATNEREAPGCEEGKSASEGLEQSSSKAAQDGEQASDQPLPEHLPPHQRMENMSLHKEAVQASNMKGKTTEGLSLDSTGNDCVNNEPDVTMGSNDLFFSDVQGSGRPVNTGLSSPIIKRSPSVSSESSGEIIVFSGRKGHAEANVSKHSLDKTGQKIRIPRSAPLEALNRNAGKVIEDPINKPDRNEAAADALLAAHQPPSPDATNSNAIQVNGKGKSVSNESHAGEKKRRRCTKKVAQEDEVLRDYIANIEANGNANDAFETSGLNNCDLGGLDELQDEDKRRLESEEQDKTTYKDYENWDSADLQDFDDFSTSTEAFEMIDQVRAKRFRPSGLQYLVVGDGHVVDDARWLPLSYLESTDASALVRDFEKRLMERDKRLGEIEDSDLSLEEDLNARQAGDERDEADLEERRKAQMTDGQIARLLSKQEELGIESNELVLFDGAELDNNEILEDVEIDDTSDGADNPRYPLRSNKNKRAQSGLSSAQAFAHALEKDPYSGFDVMDRNRPSLRKRPKGRRGKMPFEISDSEFEQSLQAQWETDRMKRKARKEEREELRAQGLLGKKAKEGTADMNAKYSEGITIAEVKNEIRDFLISSASSLALPPMGNTERRTVHEIANQFSLRSKSAGAGKSRFPVLYRTSKTRPFSSTNAHDIDIVLTSRRFLPRADKGVQRGPAASRGGRGGGKLAASYREGEVVGAGAAELGQENRGRAMLEKMGWSSGTALGAMNNKGIAVPVAQIVKTTRAGLG